MLFFPTIWLLFPLENIRLSFFKRQRVETESLRAGKQTVLITYELLLNELVTEQPLKKKEGRIWGSKKKKKKNRME